MPWKFTIRLSGVGSGELLPHRLDTYGVNNYNDTIFENLKFICKFKLNLTFSNLVFIYPIFEHQEWQIDIFQQVGILLMLGWFWQNQKQAASNSILEKPVRLIRYFKKKTF